MDKTEELKEYIKKELSSITEKFEKQISSLLEKKIDKTLAGLRYWGIGGVTLFCLVFAWLWDYKFDFTNEKHQQEIAELKQAVFTTSNEVIIREIREIKAELASFHIKPVKRKKTPIKRKVNADPDSVRGLASQVKY